MVGALGFCSRGLGLRPGHFVVSLGKTGYVHSASLQPGVKNNPQKSTCQCTQKQPPSFHLHSLELAWKLMIKCLFLLLAVCKKYTYSTERVNQ